MIGRTLPSLTIAVLAAGYSTRLGQPKALATVNGSSLLSRTLAALRPFSGSSLILVVTPPRCGSYRRVAGASGAVFHPNRERAAGLSTSVRCALSRARFSAAVLLLPVDLVRLKSRDVERLIGCWRGRRRSLVARSANGDPATPLILPHALYESARRVSGDHGLRDWARGLARSQVRILDLPSAETDVDTRTDLDLARRQRGRTWRAVSPSSRGSREMPQAPSRSRPGKHRDA